MKKKALARLVWSRVAVRAENRREIRVSQRKSMSLRIDEFFKNLSIFSAIWKSSVLQSRIDEFQNRRLFQKLIDSHATPYESSSFLKKLDDSYQYIFYIPGRRKEST